MVGKGVVWGITILVLLAPVAPGCKKQEPPRKVSLAKRGDEKGREAFTADGKPIRIAVGGMITPKEGFRYYRAFLDYIEEKLGRDVEFVDREDYAEINKLVETGDVDVAFVCGGPYVDGRRKFGMELLAAPQAHGDTVYHSYIIVPNNSPVHDFKDLRGKRFAFTDPLSNTGKLVPTYMLARMGETPGSFFKEYTYTKTHDRAIKAVAEGVVDGAAVDSLIWEYENRTAPQFTAKTRVLLKSPPYGVPPVVVSPHLDRETKNKLKAVFFTAHEDARGREILRSMMIDKFVPISDSAYDSIREMQIWIARQKQGGR